MKILMSSILCVLSTSSFAQGLKDFNGDYALNYNMGQCNATARVEITSNTVNIVNPDPRDNRGWGTTTLTKGEKKSTISGTNQTIKTTFNASEVVVEKTYKRNGSTSYQKDVYTFTEKNGKKELLIAEAVEVKGNLSGWGAYCRYEKK